MATSDAPVVVGIDGSSSALLAARWAGAVAHRIGAPLRIVHAMPSVGRNLTESSAAITAAIMSYQRDSTEMFLKAAADAVRADHADLAVSTVSDDGPAAEALIAASETARLVVVGGKSVRAAAALLVGSTTLAVVTKAACPVVAYRGEQASPDDRPVVVGVDDSPAAAVALESAFDFAGQFGAPIKAVRALSVVAPPDAGVTLPMMIDWEAVESAELSQVTSAVDAGSKRHPGVDAECFVELRSPGNAILQHADDAQLVVVGTRGRNALAGVLLGSTSLNMLHHSKVPVMVCRDAK